MQQQDTIKPADIMKLIRDKDQGFVSKTYQNAPAADAFVARPVVTPEPEVTAPTMPDEPAPPPPVDVDALCDAARQDGIETERARAEAENLAALLDLQQARDALIAAAAGLIGMTEDHAAALHRAMIRAVLKLASDRAGMQIDDAPEGFIRRIEALAERLTTHTADLRIRINPLDLQAITPHLQGSDTLYADCFVPDDTLERGDVKLRSDMVQADDILAALIPEAAS